MSKGLLRCALATLDWVLAAVMAVVLTAAVVAVDVRLERKLGLLPARDGAPGASAPSARPPPRPPPGA